MKSRREETEQVHVCCRLRPVSKAEQDLPHHGIAVQLSPTDQRVITCLTPSAASLLDNSPAPKSDTSPAAEQSNTFRFSQIFPPDAAQAAVYQAVAAPIVAGVMEGYNGTILVYGQTGSGKTYTMFGGADAGGTVHATGAATGSLAGAGVPHEGPLRAEAGESDCQSTRGVMVEAPEPGRATAPAAAGPLDEMPSVNGLQSSLQTTAKPSQKKSVEHGKRRQTGGVMRRPCLLDAAVGVIPRAVHDIFDCIAAADAATEFEVSIFLVEIYREQIRDLLATPPLGSNGGGGGGSVRSSTRGAPQRPPPSGKLLLREDVAKNAFFVEGCVVAHVSSAREVLRLVKEGQRRRATSSTAMNETSSRSHCILNITVKATNAVQGGSTVGKLHLVDLAGSEKVSKTRAAGLRLEEAKLINKSLTTLGMVIASLTDPSSTHTPYRNSILTKLLKDSLGGNSRTSLVVCCSPSSFHAAETLSTLRFGARASTIQNCVVVNEELTAVQLKRLLDSAKEEIHRLQRQINEGVDIPAPPMRQRRRVEGHAVTGVSLETLLEDRATDLARFDELQAAVAELKDALRTAQETTAVLQEERDDQVDLLHSYKAEVELWEKAYHQRQKKLQLTERQLSHSQHLLHAQAEELAVVVGRLVDWSKDVALAKTLTEQWSRSIFGPGISSQRRRTLVALEMLKGGEGEEEEEPPSLLPLFSSAAETSAEEQQRGRPGVAPASPESRRLLGGSGKVTEDGESPAERQEWPPPPPRRSDDISERRSLFCRGRGSASSLAATPPVVGQLSPATAAAQEWLLRAAPVEGAMGSSPPPSLSVTAARRIAQLESQLKEAEDEHAALRQLHSKVSSELQSRERILSIRQGHLDTVKMALQQECAAHKELQEQMEKERETIRAPLEIARNDANYWRLRFEELSTALRRRSDHPVPCSAFPVTEVSSSSQRSSWMSSERPTTAVSDALGRRVSLTMSTRSSAEDSLLSLSGHRTTSPLGNIVKHLHGGPSVAAEAEVETMNE